MGANIFRFVAIVIPSSAIALLFVQPDFQRYGDEFIRGGVQPLEDIAALEFEQATQEWGLQKWMAALEGFRKSAQKGHEVGEYCFRWGQYHEIPPSDYGQAIRWYKRGSRMQHVGCLAALGKLQISFGATSEAVLALTQTASPNSLGGERGDSLAQWFLAELYLKTGDVRRAVRWWKRSAENADIDAMMRLYEVFLKGAAGVPQEWARARYWLFAAAAHGHRDALRMVLSTAGGEGFVKPGKIERGWVEEMQRSGWF